MNRQDDDNEVTLQPEAESKQPRQRTRRTLLLGGAAAVTAAITAACTSTPSDTSTASGGGGGGSNTGQLDDVKVNPGDIDGGRDPNNPTDAKASAALEEDLPTATFAAGLEVLAVNAYKRTKTAAESGSLGAVPPAVAEFVTTVMGHHQAALDQWNRVLAVSGRPQVTTPDPRLQPTVDSVDAAFKNVKDVVGAARLALMLEDIASQTYLAAIPKLKAPESIALAASIQPIDMQHAAVLHFVLGEYPVPDVFAKTEKALSPS